MDGVQNGSCLPKSTISLRLDSGPASLAAGCTTAGVPNNCGSGAEAIWSVSRGRVGALPCALPSCGSWDTHMPMT